MLRIGDYVEVLQRQRTEFGGRLSAIWPQDEGERHQGNRYEAGGRSAQALPTQKPHQGTFLQLVQGRISRPRQPRSGAAIQLLDAVIEERFGPLLEFLK